VNNDHGFSKACPSGNIMVDLFSHGRERHPESCDRCDGLGRVWDREEIWARIQQLNRRRDLLQMQIQEMRGQTLAWKRLAAVYRAWKREGSDCPRCDGQGMY
jgi:DnaJ-class molecular chaperone